MPSATDVQGYLLALIERDEATAKANRAESQRKRYEANAVVYLREKGAFVTDTNNGPSYVVYYEGGRIHYKQVEPLLGDK